MSTTTRLTTSCVRRSTLHAIKHITIAPAARSGVIRPSLFVLTQQNNGSAPQARFFSYTRTTRMREFFPEPDSPNVRKTEAAWQHPIYTEDQMNAVAVAHRETRTISDKVALFMVKVLRTGMDFATGYKHDKAVALGKKDPAKADQKYGMTETKYMIRNIFLESVAGVPGMVAGMCRHLRSMRLMRRDNGWMETLLEESYNERMHLLIFLRMSEPGWFMRLMVLGAQGVFFNGFFLSYLVSPKTCHRFVGYLEQEAVLTYTREIADIDAGRLPNWAKMTAPDIAIDYYKMPEGKRTVRDMLMYIRADEAKHREVNHTLANLDQKLDPNPFVSQFKDDKPHPGKGIGNLKPTGWEREDCI